MKRPPSLQPSDTIALISPAGIANAENVAKATVALEAQGWRVLQMPHLLGQCGTYAATHAERGDDFVEAWTMPEVKAIMCSRGGYGSIHLLERLARLPLADNPKWLIGFSDITALHALLHSRGVMSIHGSQTKRLAMTGGLDVESAMLFDILRGGVMDYDFEPHRLNRYGSATGIIAGGNLAVMSALIATPYDMIVPQTILFIEDINEPAYRIERMLMQLKLSGVLARLGGLIVGRFTDCRTNANHATIEEMVSSVVEGYGYPVAYNVPIGHGAENVPIIEGDSVRLEVTARGVKLC